MSTPSRFSFLQMSLVLLAAGAAVALFPTPRRVAPNWTVVVQDERGQGIAGLPVTEHWNEGLLAATVEVALAPTDAKGTVVFPARTGWSCLLGSVLKTVHAVLSLGTDGPFDASVSMGAPSQEVGLSLQVSEPQAAEAQSRVVRKNDGSFAEIPW